MVHKKFGSLHRTFSYRVEKTDDWTSAKTLEYDHIIVFLPLPAINRFRQQRLSEILGHAHNNAKQQHIE